MFEFMTCIFWRCMLYIRCDFWEIFICMFFEVYWRRDVYFL